MLIIAVSILLMCGVEAVSKEAPTRQEILNELASQQDYTVDYLQKLYDKAPIMKKIAECESGDRQFYEDGTLVRGLRSADVGRFQINYVHWGKAESMGIDLETTQGNAEYALYLYERKGTQPWYMSRECWS